MTENLSKYLPRQNLYAYLDDAEAAGVYYFQAPAGYGKTVSARLWAQRHRWPCGVAALDAYDNALSAFCRRLCGALLACQPHNGLLQTYAEHPGFDGAPEAYTTRAVNALKTDEKACLIVDDLHVITNGRALAFLAGFLDALPESFTAVLLSRTPLPRELAESPVGSGMACVTTRQLSFSEAEIRRLFEQRGMPLEAQQLAEVAFSTRGWPIGVNAVLLTQGGRAGEDVLLGHLDAFIETQVWDGWDEATRAFLLQTAWEEELTPALCEALTGRADSGRMLDELVEKNAFLQRSKGGVYRFHSIFRAFLLGIANEAGEEFKCGQQRAAGGCYLAQNNFYKAVDRYAACGDHEGIARSFDLLEQMDRNEFNITSLLPIIRRVLNEDIAGEYPFLYYMMAWGAYNEGRIAEMLRHMDSYYASYERIVQRNPELAHNIFFLLGFDPRVSLEGLVGRVQAAGGVELKGVRGTLTQNMPWFHRSFRDFSELAGPGMLEKIAMLGEYIGVLLGNEKEMLLDCLAGGLLYEQGERTKALEYAERAVGQIKTGCVPESAFCARVLHTSVLAALGRQKEAARAMKALYQALEEEKALYLLDNATALDCRLQLYWNKGDAAAAWLEKRDEAPTAPVSIHLLYGSLTGIRCHIALGEWDDALIRLARVASLCRQLDRPLEILEALVLTAVAYRGKGTAFHGEALGLLGEALRLAWPYGYRQVFVGEAAALLPMFEEPALYEGDEAGFAAFARGVQAAVREEAAKQKKGRRPAPGRELRFTEKQLTVMRHLCEGCSYREIAEQMGIKFTTVRSHIQLIYKKLDVADATAAILKIRELGLLDGPG